MEEISVNKKTDDSYIIDSGSVIVQNGNYVEFNILNLKYRVQFKEDSDINFTDVEIKMDKGDDNFMNIILYNQEDFTFLGSSKKLHLGNFGNKKLWFLYSVLAVNKNPKNESDKILFYTWMYEI